MKRREFTAGAGAFLAAAGAPGMWVSGRAEAAPAGGARFEIEKSEAEWRALLTPHQFSILREEATERAFTSPLLAEKRKGIFHCAGCNLPAYPSETKYESGTGWPSFWDSLPNAIGTKRDTSFFMTRTECHCRRCGGHFGHIFDDGPKPTGLRHCLNGLALAFEPDAT